VNHERVLLVFLAIVPGLVLAAEEAGRRDPDEVWMELMAGNRRFTAVKPMRPHQTSVRRAELAKGQHPPAIVLSCSDSRVPPEIVFDRGLGDLFVVRVAGNVVDDDVLGSIEYAVEHLGSSLIVVLGHQSCGAVKAVVDKAEAAGHIPPLVTHIVPVVDELRKHGDGCLDPKVLLDQSVSANVRQSVKLLKDDETLSKFVAEHKIKVVGSRYQLDSGKVIVVE
jgi:carbonic anhydrase